MSENNMPKNELIAKLEAISDLHSKALAIKFKMNNFEPEDNYERKVIVPTFPGNYEDEEDREYLENAIDHEDYDALKQIELEFDRNFCPEEPRKPNIGPQPVPDTTQADEYKKKMGCLPIVAIFVVVCSLISGGLFSGDTVTIIANIVIIIACIVAVLYFKKKITQKQEADKLTTAENLQNYEILTAKLEEKYEQEMELYHSNMSSYKLLKANFLEQYADWRNIYIESIKEEEEIEEKLEADRQAAVDKIKEEEFTPTLNELVETNDLISNEYLPALDSIIGLLKSSRADNLKEAINLYEDIVYREKQLELEREKEENRQREEAMKRDAEERYHQEQMEFQKQQEYNRQQEASLQREAEERRHKEEMQAREAEARNRELQERENRRREELKAAADQREQEAKLRSAAFRQCQACIHGGRCSMRGVNTTPNCTGFRPR